MNIQNKVAIVSGASSGLGAAIAKLLIEKGAQVYGIARNKKKPGALKANLGGSFIPVSLDISEIATWLISTRRCSHQTKGNTKMP